MAAWGGVSRGALGRGLSPLLERCWLGLLPETVQGSAQQFSSQFSHVYLSVPVRAVSEDT